MRHDLIIKDYARQLGMGFMYEQWQMANVKADKSVLYPLLVFVTPASGRFNIDMGLSLTDSPNCLFAFLAPVQRHDYDGGEGAPTFEWMKAKALEFINIVNTAGDYEPVGGEVGYQLVFHKLDKDLMGVSLELRLTPAKPECLADYTFDNGE